VKESQITRSIGRWRFLPLVGCTLLFVGCASMTDWKYEQTQHHRAREAYKACGNPCGECYPKDYRSGWLDGYYAGLTGDGCCPPSIAPARYWDPHQILDDCDNRRHAYYSGWQDGAAAAARCPDTHYLKVWESCECPMPRCEKPCGPLGVCGCQGPCECGGVAPPIHGDGQMIEVISDVEIGTAHSLSEGMMGEIDEASEPASDAEVDEESVPEAPVTDDEEASHDLEFPSPVRPVGFQEAPLSMTPPADTTPAELFGTWR